MKKYMWLVSLLVISIVGTMFAGCAPPQEERGEPQQEEGEEPAGFTGEYKFGGSTALEPIFTSAIEAFQDLHPDVRLSYDAPGSTVGIQGAIDGIYSLAGASRDLKDEEITAGAVDIQIALDSLAVIVHGEVGVDSLTLEQVARIFAGEYKNWSDVGGGDAPIVVVNRDEASGTFGAFEDLVMEEVLGDEAEFRADAIVAASAGDVVTKVSGTPNTIGYVGFGHLDRVKEAGAKYILVDNIEMTIESVKAGQYPISRRVYAVHKGEPVEGSVEKAFVDFLLSAEGQAIVEEEGFIRLP